MTKSHIFIAYLLLMFLQKNTVTYATYYPELPEIPQMSNYSTPNNEGNDSSEEEKYLKKVQKTTRTLPSKDLQYLNRLTHDKLAILEDYVNEKEITRTLDLTRWSNFHEKASRVLKGTAYCCYAAGIVCYGVAVFLSSRTCDTSTTVIGVVSGTAAAAGAGLQYLGFKSSEAYEARDKKIKKSLETGKEVHGIYNKELRNRDLFSTGDEKTESDITPRKMESQEGERDLELGLPIGLKKTYENNQSFDREEISSPAGELAPSDGVSSSSSSDSVVIEMENPPLFSNKTGESETEYEEVDLHNSV